MNREEFVGYLESRAEALKIALHCHGELRGLPRKFHQALAVAHLLDALEQPAPSGEDLRAWYGLAVSASPEAARWAYRVVGSLRNQDLQALDTYELVAFSNRFDTWGGFANAFASDRKRK